MQKTITSQSVWDACGNVIGIVELNHDVYGAEYSCAENMVLRSHLAKWGKGYGCDSIMLLTQSQTADIHAEVFEPNAGTNTVPGGISSMCGNGIRAVGAFFKSKRFLTHQHLRVSTLSGCRTVSTEYNDQYTCDMGVFHDTPKAMEKYINTSVDGSTLLQLLKEIELIMGNAILHWGIGLSGNEDTEGNVDGEPHLVLIFDSPPYKDTTKAKQIVARIGELLTKNLSLFPSEINTNVSFVKEINSHKFELSNFTFERNLGNDPTRSITKSCGTGATALAGVLFRQYHLPESTTILVNNIGGQLEVSKRGENLFLTGNAIRIS